MSTKKVPNIHAFSFHFAATIRKFSDILATSCPHICCQFWQQKVHIFWHFGSKLSTYWLLILAAKVHILFAHVGSICPQIYFTIWQQITNISVLWGRILSVETTWQMFHDFSVFQEFFYQSFCEGPSICVSHLGLFWHAFLSISPQCCLYLYMVSPGCSIIYWLVMCCSCTKCTVCTSCWNKCDRRKSCPLNALCVCVLLVGICVGESVHVTRQILHLCECDAQLSCPYMQLSAWQCMKQKLI